MLISAITKIIIIDNINKYKICILFADLLYEIDILTIK